MQFIGILLRKTEEREGDSAYGHWKVAQYLLETVGMYPKKMVVDVSDGATGRIAAFDAMVGKSVIVSFEPNATEYNGRWYNKFTAYKIEDYAEYKAKEVEREEEAKKSGTTAQTPAPPFAPEGPDDDPPF